MTWSLDEFYDNYPRLEEEFSTALDESLNPHGPETLFDLVAGFSLPPGAAAIDVGCGEGRHALELASRFGFRVIGIDPVPRHIEIARASTRSSEVTFQQGFAEQLPAERASADLIWCRDVLVHVADLAKAYREFRRVLTPGGRVLVYQMFGTPLLEEREAAWLWNTMGVVPSSAELAHTESAIAEAGLLIDQRITFGTEWGEWAEERHGDGGRRLLHTSRLLRGREQFVERFGPAAYETMLGDCLWHVYGMIGKLSRQVYLLSSPG